ncbi:hypothetical protein MRX96_037564 [Rhipicephalus microplus]
MEEMRQPLEVVRDDQQSTEHESVFRANLADEDAVNEWMEAYSVRTNTSWIVGPSRVLGKGLTAEIIVSKFRAALQGDFIDVMAAAPFAVMRLLRQLRRDVKTATH